MEHEHDSNDWPDRAAHEAEHERRRERETDLRWKRYNSPSRRHLEEQYDRACREGGSPDDERGDW